MDEKTPEIIQTENLIILEDNFADAHEAEVILDENTVILASGDTYSILNMPYLRSAAKNSGKSFEDVAEEKGISVSSIYKFFAMKSKSPSFYNLVMICDAYGISVDELCNLSAYRNRLRKQEPSLSAQIADLTETVDTLRKTVENQSKLIDALLRDLHRSDEY